MGAFFQINDIREHFIADNAMMRKESLAAAAVLAGGNTENRGEHLLVIRRHTHSLKGLGGMVNAQALRAWGDGLEKVVVAAETWSPEQNQELFSQICQMDADWEHMITLSLDGKLTEAVAFYHELRTQLPESLQSYFLHVQEGENPCLVQPPMPPLRLKPTPHSAETNAPHILGKAVEDASDNSPAVANAITPRLKAAKVRFSPAPAPEPEPPKPEPTPPAAPEAEENNGPQPASPIMPRLKAAKVRFSPAPDPSPEPEPLPPPPAEPAPAEAEENNGPQPASPVMPRLKAAKVRFSPNPSPPPEPEPTESNVPLASPATPALRVATPRGESQENVAPARPLMPTLRSVDGREISPAPEPRPGENTLTPSAQTPPLQPASARGPEIAAPMAPQLKVRAQRVSAPAPVADPGVDQELLEYFRQDAEDQVRAMERAVLRWEKQEDTPAQIKTVRRAFHTLKGAANSVGLTNLGKDFHVAEDHIQAVTSGKKPASHGLFQFLLRAVDQLRGLMGQLRAGKQPVWGHRWAVELQNVDAAGGESQVSWDEAAQEELEMDFAANAERGEVQQDLQVRVDARRVSELGNLLSQVVTDRRRVEDRLLQFRGLTNALQERAGVLNRTVNSFQKQFEFQLLGQQKQAAPALAEMNSMAHGAARSMADEFSELEFDRYDEASLLSRSLAEVASDLDQLLGEWGQTLHEMESDASQFKQTSRAIQDAVGHLTLVAFDEVGPRLQRIFRDAVAVEQKEVRLDFVGAETRLDKALVERIYPALLHLVRNAVSHGVESPEARQQTEKEPVGRVVVKCSQIANQILISVADDGGGVDEPKVRAKAVKEGLWHDPESAMSSTQILRVLCHAGFSTAQTLSDVAGRGVGMDVVRGEIEAMNGTLELHFQPGQGTSWVIRLPLTLSISEGVIIRAGKQLYALPMNTVLGGLSLQGETTTKLENGVEQISYQGQQVPLLRLSSLLQVGDGLTSERALAISSLDKTVVLAVDELVGRAELPIRPMDPFTACHPLFESGTIDPNGNIVPILSATMLVKLPARPELWGTQRHLAADARPVVDRPQVLVVDDSVSVRKVQQSMLASLNCDVVTAVDGLDGLEKLRSQHFDIILSDLEMPRLNGYEFIAEIRSNPAWARTPVIVISSRTTDKHVARAMNLGATSFLFKPFTDRQIRLLIDKHVRKL